MWPCFGWNYFAKIILRIGMEIEHVIVQFSLSPFVWKVFQKFIRMTRDRKLVTSSGIFATNFRYISHEILVSFCLLGIGQKMTFSCQCNLRKFEQIHRKLVGLHWRRSVLTRSFSGSNFPASGLNTEIYSKYP